MKNSKSGTAARLIRLSFALAFLLPWSASSWIASTSASQETGSLSLELLAPAYSVQSESDGFTSIQAEGFTSSDTPGGLALPHRVLQVALPPQADLNSVTLEINSLQVETLPGVYQIQTLPPDSPGDALSTWVTNPGASQQAAASGFARLLSSGQMRKWRFASLGHSPFAYDPASGKLSLASRVLVTIHYKVDPAAADLALLSDDLMDDLAQSKFYNYDQAQAWYPVVDTPDQPGAVYDYVIITTNAIEAGSNKLDDFILHKQNRGFSVLTITESEYGGLAGQSPNGNAEKIRKWLQDNYVSFGIQYVLLVGNPDPDDPSIGDTVGDLPMKMCWPRRTASDGYLESPTDYFFADLTGNWDKDGDGYFGEYTEDMGTGGVDFAPEVYVGRIPVYSSAYSTLDAILQKIMDYENEASPLSWRKNALLPMSFGAPGYDGAPLAEQMMDDYLDGASFTSWTQYQQGSGACSLDSIYTSSQELRGGTVVRDRWAANDYGLVLWWGHGSQTTAAVGYDSCWDGTLFEITQTSSLDDDHPSFVYLNSCTNGYPENSSNLQYSLLNQGAVATVGASRVSWFNTGEVTFNSSTTNAGIGYEYAKHLAAGQSAAEALYNAKSSIIPNQATRLMNYFDFNLYGDPATYLLPPAAPAAFNKTSPGNAATGQPASLTLSWQSTSPVTRYEYCYDTSDDNSCASWIHTNLQTSASLDGLSNDTTYYWQVRAWNESAAPTYANSGSWWNFTVMPQVQPLSVFLPLVIRTAPSTSSGIYGKVTQNGNDAEGIPLELRFYNGSAYSTLMSTSTTNDGSYQFTGIPDLTPGQGYYVQYLNSTGVPGRLSLWATQFLNAYTSGEDVNIGNFDIADIPLVSPFDGSLLALPQTFQWTRRTATPTDSYEFNIYDPVDDDPWWWTDPALGYVSSHTLNSLPPGFSSGKEYEWNLWVYSPDGGYGISNASNSVTFTGSGIVSGRVTYNGSPAAGVGLEMRRWNGSAWSTQSSTTTAGNGIYQFTNLPSLSSGQAYYVRYQNDENTAGRLWYWRSVDLTSYVSGSDYRVEDFDIADIQLVSPAVGATVSLPAEFQWVPRTATLTDNYEFNLFDPNNTNTWWYTDPLLGYTGSYTLNSLPPGFAVGIDYGWEIYVYSPSGGYGISYYYRTVRFLNSGSASTETYPALAGKGNTDIPVR